MYLSPWRTPYLRLLCSHIRLHDFLHSLSVGKVSILLSSKILRKVRRVYQFLNVVMNYCRSEVVMLGSNWSWIFRRARKTSCGCTAALLSTRWSGLQIQFSHQPLLAPPRTTFLCLTFQPHTQGLFDDGFTKTSHTNPRTRCSIGLNPSRGPIPNLPDETLSIHSHHDGIMRRRCSFLCRTCPLPFPCSLTETSPLYHLAHQHLSTFPKHGGMNWI